jgi:hypothetical protein
MDSQEIADSVDISDYPLKPHTMQHDSLTTLRQSVVRNSLVEMKEKQIFTLPPDQIQELACYLLESDYTSLCSSLFCLDATERILICESLFSELINKYTLSLPGVKDGLLQIVYKLFNHVNSMGLDLMDITLQAKVVHFILKAKNVTENRYIFCH